MIDENQSKCENNLGYYITEDRCIDDIIIIVIFLFLFSFIIKPAGDRFHVAMHLLSILGSQKMWKCGNNIASCTTFWSYHILMSSVSSHWTDAQQHGIFLFISADRKQLNIIVWTTTFIYFLCSREHSSNRVECRRVSEFSWFYPSGQQFDPPPQFVRGEWRHLHVRPHNEHYIKASLIK